MNNGNKEDQNEEYESNEMNSNQNNSLNFINSEHEGEEIEQGQEEYQEQEEQEDNGEEYENNDDQNNNEVKNDLNGNANSIDKKQINENENEPNMLIMNQEELEPSQGNEPKIEMIVQEDNDNNGKNNIKTMLNRSNRNKIKEIPKEEDEEDVNNNNQSLSNKNNNQEPKKISNPQINNQKNQSNHQMEEPNKANENNILNQEMVPEAQSQSSKHNKSLINSEDLEEEEQNNNEDIQEGNEEDSQDQEPDHARKINDQIEQIDEIEENKEELNTSNNNMDQEQDQTSYNAEDPSNQQNDILSENMQIPKEYDKMFEEIIKKNKNNLTFKKDFSKTTGNNQTNNNSISNSANYSYSKTFKNKKINYGNNLSKNTDTTMEKRIPIEFQLYKDAEKRREKQQKNIYNNLMKIELNSTKPKISYNSHKIAINKTEKMIEDAVNVYAKDGYLGFEDLGEILSDLKIFRLFQKGDGNDNININIEYLKTIKETNSNNISYLSNNSKNVNKSNMNINNINSNSNLIENKSNHQDIENKDDINNNDNQDDNASDSASNPNSLIKNPNFNSNTNIKINLQSVSSPSKTTSLYNQKSYQNYKDIQLEMLSTKETEKRKTREQSFHEQFWFTLNPSNKPKIKSDLLSESLKILFAPVTSNFRDISIVLSKFLMAAFFFANPNDVKKYISPITGKEIEQEYVWSTEKLTKEFLYLKENILAYQPIKHLNKSTKNDLNIAEKNMSFKPQINNLANWDYNKEKPKLLDIQKKRMDKLAKIKKEEEDNEVKDCIFMPKINKDFEVERKFCDDCSDKNDNVSGENKFNVFNYLYNNRTKTEQKIKEMKDKQDKADKLKISETCTFKPELVSKGYYEKNKEKTVKKPKGFDEFAAKMREGILKRKKKKYLEKRIPTGQNYEKVKNANIQPFNITDLREKNNVQKENKKNEEYFNIQMKILNGKERTIKVYLTDEPYEVAEDFCKTYGLKDEIKERLAKTILSFRTLYIQKKNKNKENSEVND